MTRKQATYKLLEIEIRQYHGLKQRLDEQRDFIIRATQKCDVPSKTGPGNPTLLTVLRLQNCPIVEELERRVRAVGWALSIIEKDPAKKRFVELKYFEDRLTDAGIMKELGVASRTLYRWRVELLHMIATKLGWE